MGKIWSTSASGSDRNLFGTSFAVFLCIVLSIGDAGIRLSADENSIAKPVSSKRGLVVSVSHAATQAGRDVLSEGGNAVDAAVSTALALAVTFPRAGNLGGGGFMMVHPSDKRPVVCVEYRERAPAAVSDRMYSLGESHLGIRKVAVPGTVAGLWKAHQTYGQLGWSRLVQPAIRLARDGFALDEESAESFNAVLTDPKSGKFREFRRVFGSKSGAWKSGDRLIQPELAQVLQRLAIHGPKDFYEGRTAELIIAEMRRSGGLITHADLRTYEARIRLPVHTVYRDFDVYGPPPPSSGGICLGLMLQMLEPYELRQRDRWDPQTAHLLIEAMRRGFLERARFLGDQDFVRIPPQLLRREYAEFLRQGVDLQQATRSVDLAGDLPLAGEGPDTTHFSVVDASGMAVSNTYTLEYSYGSRVVVPGAGFLLNNEMGDFNWKPGHTDALGNIGTPANTIVSGKRMLSSQTPVIVARDGRPVLVTGSPGGRTIINTVLQVVLNIIEFEMPLAKAVQSPRLHHQWLPDLVRFEGIGEDRWRDWVMDLEQRGHRFDPTRRRQGDAHSIAWDEATDRYEGFADPRISGSAQGVMDRGRED